MVLRRRRRTAAIFVLDMTLNCRPPHLVALDMTIKCRHAVLCMLEATDAAFHHPAYNSVRIIGMFSA